jgi:hypothetical protein
MLFNNSHVSKPFPPEKLTAIPKRLKPACPRWGLEEKGVRVGGKKIIRLAPHIREHN